LNLLESSIFSMMRFKSHVSAKRMGSHAQLGDNRNIKLIGVIASGNPNFSRYFTNSPPNRFIWDKSFLQEIDWISDEVITDSLTTLKTAFLQIFKIKFFKHILNWRGIYIENISHIYHMLSYVINQEAFYFLRLIIEFFSTCYHTGTQGFNMKRRCTLIDQTICIFSKIRGWPQYINISQNHLSKIDTRRRSL